MKKIVFISFLLILLSSCEKSFPDYNKKKAGVFMKLVSFDDDEKSLNKSTAGSASISIFDGNKLIYKLYKEEVFSIENNPLSFLLKLMNEGDSALFMVSSDKLMKALNNTNQIHTDYCRAEIKLYKYYTQNELDTILKNNDKEMMEQLLLSKYLNESKAKHYNPGFYKEQLSKGKGKGITKGNVITIKYKGNFINRIEFDNNYKDAAFTFTYGTPEQVIKGLDIAINGMKKGEKAKIIIPSQLAFGEEGSSTKIVPPFTTVIYELEIINVK